jgi:hypothetical protein
MENRTKDIIYGTLTVLMLIAAYFVADYRLTLRVDGSSIKSARRSLNIMRSRLRDRPVELRRFNRSVNRIVFKTGLAVGTALRASGGYGQIDVQKEIDNLLIELLDGMSIDDIMDEGRLHNGD